MNALKILLIILVLVVAAPMLSLCGDSIGVGCSHGCCVGSERLRPLQRLARKLKCMCRSFTGASLLPRSHARSSAMASLPAASTSALLKVSALRI